jgi:hypothetical protein
MKVIAADVTRRVIEAAKAPLQKRRDWHAQREQSASDLQVHAERLAKQYPTSLRVKVENGADSASIFSHGSDDHYLAARLYPDGSVSIDRIGTLKGGQFAAVADALFKKGTKQ